MPYTILLTLDKTLYRVLKSIMKTMIVIGEIPCKQDKSQQQWFYFRRVHYKTHKASFMVAVSSFLTENGVKTKLEELHYEGICAKSP